MYVVPVTIQASPIDGRGVFAASSIKKGTIVWQYTDGHDSKMSVQDFNALDAANKKALERVAYLSPTSGRWVVPPQDDPACYTNHRPHGYNTSVQVDPAVSDEPFFVANQDISAGQEITNNYLDFDNNTKPNSFTWL